MFIYHLAKLCGFCPAKNNNEIGRLFSAFLYPFEDDILKQPKYFVSMFVYYLAKLSFACQKQWNWQITFGISIPFWGWHTKTKYFISVHIQISKTGSFENEIGRLFLAFLYPLGDDILKQNHNILSMFIYLAKLEVLPAKNHEIGRLFLAFLYPFDDILKQYQSVSL